MADKLRNLYVDKSKYSDLDKFGDERWSEFIATYMPGNQNSKTTIVRFLLISEHPLRKFELERTTHLILVFIYRRGGLDYQQSGLRAGHGQTAQQLCFRADGDPLRIEPGAGR